MKHKLCQTCKKNSRCKLGEYKYMQAVLDGGCYGYQQEKLVKKKTHGDRLRAKNNEELGRWLAAHVNLCMGSPKDCSKHNHNCWKCWKNWLDAEAEECF